MIKIGRRNLSSCGTLFKSNALKGFVFDIDGVIVRGSKPIARAKQTFELLEEQNIPFCLLTNGGGYKELDRLKQIYNLIGFRPKNIELSKNKIVLSHTPYKEYVQKYKKILAVGPRGTTKEVALEYGFEEVYEVQDLVRYNRTITPFTATAPGATLDRCGVENIHKTPFDAIFVFTDPRDWGADIQVINDLLNSDRGMLNTFDGKKHSGEPGVPIFWSQKDLYWSNQYSLKRYGLGMFREIIRQTYRIDNHGLELKDTVFGKPMKIAYDYASKILPHTCADGTGSAQIDKNSIYMVGDNPASDIIGAHNYGWKTCLVETGVYKKGDLLPCKPTHIVPDLYEAVLSGLDD